jgi:hypothetical protein
MKNNYFSIRHTNTVGIILALLAFICFAIAFSSCSILFYESEPILSEGERRYEEWCAEQRDYWKRVYEYTQTEEYKRKHGGINKAAKGVHDTGSESIIGTRADQLSTIRYAPVVTHYNFTIK